MHKHLLSLIKEQTHTFHSKKRNKTLAKTIARIWSKTGACVTTFVETKKQNDNQFFKVITVISGQIPTLPEKPINPSPRFTYKY